MGIGKRGQEKPPEQAGKHPHRHQEPGLAVHPAGPVERYPTARYTHRVAISNSRLVSLDDRGVTFRYKDYRRNGQARYRTMTLSCDEFIRRFLLHILPKGFHRIRHYGLLASAGCKTNIARAKELIAAIPEVEPLAAHDTADPDATTDHRPLCPCCGGRMIIVEVLVRAGAPRGPPPSGAGIRI